MKALFAAFFFLLIVLAVYSYGFVDPNLTLSHGSLYQLFQEPIHTFVFMKKDWAAGMYGILTVSLFVFYVFILKKIIQKKLRINQLRTIVLVIFMILLWSFPAFSYDIFNYILTAKVTYTYHENPYLVMPTDIPNEPMLAYTRAANKVALYGPTWIGLTSLPHVIGGQGIWSSIVSFKLLTAGFYLALSWLVFKITKSIWSVAFFSLNPLILVETLVSGHNDVVMMAFAIYGLILLREKKRLKIVTGLLMLGASVLVKGASLILLPLLFARTWESSRFFKMAYLLMFGVFLLSPIREEMYPWYAMWFLPFAALVPYKKHSFLHEWSIALSFGLLLRHLPYIYTREYGGIGPMIRTMSTLAPPLLYTLWRGIRVWRTALQT